MRGVGRQVVHVLRQVAAVIALSHVAGKESRVGVAEA